MVFITKPVVWLQYAEIQEMVFAIGQVHRQTFELQVILRAPGGSTQLVEFCNIERAVMKPLLDFFTANKVPISNIPECEQVMTGNVNRSVRVAARRAASNFVGSAEKERAVGAEDEEDDKDFESGDEGADSNSDDDSDGSLVDSDDDKPAKKKPKRK